MSTRIESRELDRAVRLIRTSNRFFLGTHVRPDGDALGSLLGLALALESRGAQVARLAADPVPPTYLFLPSADQVTSQPPSWQPDVGIALDCDGSARLGALEPAFLSLPHLMDIDHHATDRTFGEVRLVDPAAAATGEIVHLLLERLGAPPTPGVATCLYTAVLTDTGRFSYGNTSANALALAARLVAAGAQPELIARRVYAERSMAATHLLGVALSRLSADVNGVVVSSTLSLSDFAETGATAADTEGIIDHLRAIGGPRVALLLVQMAPEEVRVSLRSDGSVDVSAIAYRFGGGGHAMAAGCLCQGTVEKARREVLAAVSECLQSDATHAC